MDDKQRIALVETRTQGNDHSPEQLVRYQFGNHLGSASLELDDQANVISYEEYHPYGSTSYQAVRKDIEVPRKRYRYTGKERDEESGLFYHGARYYAPWLVRWTSCDPTTLDAGINLYRFVDNNPIRYSDSLGLAPADKVETDDLVRQRTNYDPVKGSAEYTSAELANKSGTTHQKARGPGARSKRHTEYVQSGGGKIQAHHYADVKSAEGVGLNTDIMNEKNRMINVHSRKDLIVKGQGTADLPHTHHKSLQDIKDVVAGRLDPTKAGLVDASGETKFRTPNTIDQGDRLKAFGGRANELVRETDTLTHTAIKLERFAKLNSGVNTYMTLSMAGDLYKEYQGTQSVVPVLKDKNGNYTLGYKGLIFKDYYKTYISGSLQGTIWDIGSSEFKRDMKTVKEKYGYFNVIGGWIPGKISRDTLVDEQCKLGVWNCS